MKILSKNIDKDYVIFTHLESLDLHGIFCFKNISVTQKTLKVKYENKITII